MSTTLIVPGLRGSGTDHWQTWFERRIPNSLRVIQSDWTDAYLPDWASRVRRAIHRATAPVYVVAHSFGCLAAAQAVWDMQELVAGAMLVAPSDPDTFGVGDLLPSGPLGVPSVVVASTNDPWMSARRAEAWAALWGARLISIGRAGHINPSSGYGPWPEGLAILNSLRETTEDISRLPAIEDDLAFRRHISWTSQ